MVKARGKAAFKTLQPYVQQLLQSGTTDMQVTVLTQHVCSTTASSSSTCHGGLLQEDIAAAITAIAKDRSLGGRDVAEALLPWVMGQLKKERSDEVRQCKRWRQAAALASTRYSSSSCALPSLASCSELMIHQR